MCCNVFSPVGHLKHITVLCKGGYTSPQGRDDDIITRQEENKYFVSIINRSTHMISFFNLFQSFFFFFTAIATCKEPHFVATFRR